MTDHLVFLTGKLAKISLEKVLSDISSKNKFTYDVIDIGVNVAALATIKIIIKKIKLDDISKATKIIIPGRCRGNIEELEKFSNKKCLRGPEELKDIPGFLGMQGKDLDLSKYDTKIIGEITEAPNMSIGEILDQAFLYKKDGADIIDIGCLPSTKFDHLSETIQELKNQDFIVSVDSLDTDNLITGANAGADFLLSLQEKSIWVMDEVDSIPVIIPDYPQEEKNFYKLINKLLKDNKQFIVDSILEPINFGFTDSIVRYQNLRKNFPSVEVMMGIGNLTELTHADTAGMNALLFGITSELNINYALCTQVSEHCNKAIIEGNFARRIMYSTKKYSMPPKDISNKLLNLHERKPFPYKTNELKEMWKNVKDKNYRIYVNDDGIHVFNNSNFYTEKDAAEFYQYLDIKNDDGHAYYLGMELARAEIAYQLGKRYDQDELLKWGCSVDISEDDLMRFKTAGHTMRKIKENKKD
jgi:dihydropteroate synthase-like protein